MNQQRPGLEMGLIKPPNGHISQEISNGLSLIIIRFFGNILIIIGFSDALYLVYFRTGLPQIHFFVICAALCVSKIGYIVR